MMVAKEVAVQPVELQAGAEMAVAVRVVATTAGA